MKEKYPLNNNCLSKNIIYRATIKTSNITKFMWVQQAQHLKTDIATTRQALITN